MEIQKIRHRGVLFSFDDLAHSSFGNQTTHVYAVIMAKSFLLLDTYMGPVFMSKVRDFLKDEYGDKPFVLVNSHFHWDHVFGNCAFKGSIIISHEKCRQIMQSEYDHFSVRDFDNYLKQYEFALPEREIEIVLPNVLFSDRLSFPDEDLFLFYASGHTVDSISLYDSRDNVLFAGDNVELPHPTYLDPNNVSDHRATLENYLRLEAQVIIPGHDAILSREDLQNNICYLSQSLTGQEK